MAKCFRHLKEALSHAAVHGRPRGYSCPLGGPSHYQSGDDGPDEYEALVIRTIVRSACRGDDDAVAGVYRWATSGGMSGHCPKHLQEVLRARLRRAGVMSPPLKRVRTKRKTREYEGGDTLTTSAVDEG